MDFYHRVLHAFGTPVPHICPTIRVDDKSGTLPVSYNVGGTLIKSTHEFKLGDYDVEKVVFVDNENEINIYDGRWYAINQIGPQCHIYNNMNCVINRHIAPVSSQNIALRRLADYTSCLIYARTAPASDDECIVCLEYDAKDPIYVYIDKSLLRRTKLPDVFVDRKTRTCYSLNLDFIFSLTSYEDEILKVIVNPVDKIVEIRIKNNCDIRLSTYVIRPCKPGDLPDTQYTKRRCEYSYNRIINQPVKVALNQLLLHVFTDMVMRYLTHR